MQNSNEIDASVFTVDTLQDTIADAYENANSFHSALVLSDLVGTAMHIEADENDEIAPMSANEIRSLVNDDTFDWLVS
jgi:hypothetical protein